MNWQHLMYFKSVAKLQNYGKAADELFITSSALSKAIHSLEEELGFPLFQKQGRNSYLTAYGQTFFQCISRCSDEIDQCLKSIYSDINEISGHLCISGIYTMCAEYLPNQIRIFKNQYPDISITMEYHTTEVILQQISSGMVDLGFCGNFDSEDKAYSNVDRVAFKQEELIVLVPSSHHLASKKEISLSDVKDETFVVHKHRTTGTGAIFMGLCEKYHFTPHIGFEVPDDQSILGLVRNGLGIALLADSPSLKIEGTTAVRLSGEHLMRTQYIVWKKGSFLSPVAKAFQKQIITSLKAEQKAP